MVLGVGSEGGDEDGADLTRHFATYCDAAYLPRLKALYASMKRHCGDFVLHVLAWDNAVLGWTLSVANVAGEGISDFLSIRADLVSEFLPGPHRSGVEHMWTVGPWWISDVMKRTGGPVTYVDADMFAFSSPDLFFSEAGDAPAAFCGHNFAPASRGLPGPTWESHAGLFGSLNVGLCHFNDVRVAQRWADLCREWCFDRPDGVFSIGGRPVSQRYGDQKYLEQLVTEFGAVVIQNEAAMVGPWNVHAQPLRMLGGVPHFGGKPIGFYHFSGFRMGPHGHWSPSRPEYQITEAQVDMLYVPYLKAIEEASR